jgi:hypothetical protein
MGGLPIPADARLRPRRVWLIVVSLLLLAAAAVAGVFVTVPRGVNVGPIDVHSTRMTFNATTLNYRCEQEGGAAAAAGGVYSASPHLYDCCTAAWPTKHLKINKTPSIPGWHTCAHTHTSSPHTCACAYTRTHARTLMPAPSSPHPSSPHLTPMHACMYV